MATRPRLSLLARIGLILRLIELLIRPHTEPLSVQNWSNFKKEGKKPLFKFYKKDLLESPVSRVPWSARAWSVLTTRIPWFAQLVATAYLPKKIS